MDPAEQIYLYPASVAKNVIHLTQCMWQGREHVREAAFSTGRLWPWKHGPQRLESHLPRSDLLLIRLGHFRSLHIIEWQNTWEINISDKVIDHGFEYGYMENSQPLNKNEWTEVNFFNSSKSKNVVPPSLFIFLTLFLKLSLKLCHVFLTLRCGSPASLLAPFSRFLRATSHQ